MVVVGSDVHKRTHTFVAVDEAGRKLGELTVKADAEGSREGDACGPTGSSVASAPGAIEDCRHLSARLELDLLDRRRTGGAGAAEDDGRDSVATARTRGKSDAIDALAVARAVLVSPTAGRDSRRGLARAEDAVDRREDLVGERTRMMNRLRWHVHRIAPGDPARRSRAEGSGAGEAPRGRSPSGWSAQDGHRRPSWPAKSWPTSTESPRPSTTLERADRRPGQGAVTRAARAMPGCAERHRGETPRRSRRGRPDSPPRRSTPGTPATRRSRSGRAAPRAESATPDRAIGSSTPRCTASQSPKIRLGGLGKRVLPTSASLRATPAPKPYAP